MNKKQRKSKVKPIVGVIFSIAVIIALGLLVVNSLQQKQMTSVSIDLYYLESTTSLMKPEKREIKAEQKSDILSNVLIELANGPKTEGLTGVIPKDVTFQKVNLNGDVAIVDVNSAYSQMKSGAELLCRASIVWTLTGLDFVDSVMITVDGMQLTKTNGEPIGNMKREDIVLDAEISPSPTNVTTVKLFFTNPDATGLAEEEREIEVNPNEPLEKYVMEQLIIGPKKEGLIATVPSETKIREIKTVDGICYLDLSSEFVSKHNGGSTGETLTIYSIVNSLTQLSNIKKVQFLIEGEKLEEFKGHFDFSKPFAAMEVNV